jgi:hypothetical protein
MKMNHFSTNKHSLVNFSGRWMLLVLPPKNLKRVGLGQGMVTRKKSLDGGLSGNPTICHRIRTWPWKKTKNHLQNSTHGGDLSWLFLSTKA